MEIQQYVEKKKLIQKSLLVFIESEENLEENYENLVLLIKDQKIQDDSNEIKALLYTISKISNNHTRSPTFVSKIEKILLLLQKTNKQTLSKIDFFNIFKNNKILLHFLFEQKMINLDESIYSFLMQNKYQKQEFPLFLIEDIRKSVRDKKIGPLIRRKPENFEEKQKIGENDSKIAEIIRKDSIDEFISYVNQTNLMLTSNIEYSIFETNSFLMKKEMITLIEYASFFGSINIIKYLHNNGVDLTSSLWIYSIHSNKFELIHFLEENNVEPEDKSYVGCIKEAVKCHHNEIANYLIEKFVPKDKSKKTKINRELNERISVAAIPALKNNHEIVDLLLKQPKAKITKEAFIYCTRLSEITIPSSITYIGKKAFKGCSSLKKISTGSSVTEIDEHAFNICSKLEEITISSSLITLGKCAFSSCKSLKKVIFEEPSSLKIIGISAFSDCVSLVDISIPSSVTTINNNAFVGCFSLKNVFISSSVTEIGSGVFHLCKSLEKIEFENNSSLVSIKDAAFKGCSSLISIKLPQSIQSIGENIFEKCSSLEKISIPSTFSSLENIPSNVKIERY